MPPRILYIDDDDASLDAIKRLLACFKYEVLTASDVVTGIQMAHAHQPGVILMNVHMPAMSGIEATQYLKMQPDTRLIPIIALTADVYTHDDCMAAGCSAYLNKPIRKDELVKIVQHWLKLGKTASLSL